jgi:hypothetical protein
VNGRVIFLRLDAASLYIGLRAAGSAHVALEGWVEFEADDGDRAVLSQTYR